MITKRVRQSVSLAVLAGLAMATASAGQDQLRPNGGMGTSMGSHHPVGADGGRFQCYALQTRAGEQYKVMLFSDVFTPALRVGKGPSCENLTKVVEDRQLEGERGADVQLSGDGSLWLIKAIAPAGGTGGYYIQIDRTLTVPPTPVKIAFGQTLNGALTPDDALTVKYAAYDCYSFQAARGDDLIVTMRSSAFKPAVALYANADCQGTPIEFENKGGDGEAILAASIANTETYSIRARSLLRDAFGPYTLALQRR